MKRLTVPSTAAQELQRLVVDLNLLLATVEERLGQLGGRADALDQRIAALEIFTPPSVAKADLPADLAAGTIRFVPDEAGGPTLAAFDGTDWRRLYDNAVVS